MYKIPIFGWFLKNSDYIPFGSEGSNMIHTMEIIQNLNNFFKCGGNLFVFPEGTRNKKGEIGDFHKGVFSIARRYNVPIELLCIQKTNILMKLGNLWLSTCQRITIKVDLIGSLKPDYYAENFSMKKLISDIRSRYINYLKLNR